MLKRKGFTLIELLVVIAIIALLMAILMPALQRVKKQTKAVVCQANLKQWGLVFATFCDDNDGRFIGGNNPESGSGTPGAESWPEVLYPYYKARDIQFCPEAVREEGLHWGDKTRAWNYGWEGDVEYAGSYGINDWVYDPGPRVSTTWGIDLTGKNWSSPDVKGANNAPLFLDCVHIGSVPTDTAEPPEQDERAFYWTASGMMGRYCMNRHHNGTINCLFMDFSARPVGLKQLWTLKWHRQFRINGPWTIGGGAMPEDWPEWMRGFKDY